MYIVEAAKNPIILNEGLFKKKVKTTFDEKMDKKIWDDFEKNGPEIVRRVNDNIDKTKADLEEARKYQKSTEEKFKDFDKMMKRK